jgi:hypothetical protein
MRTKAFDSQPLLRAAHNGMLLCKERHPEVRLTRLAAAAATNAVQQLQCGESPLHQPQNMSNPVRKSTLQQQQQQQQQQQLKMMHLGIEAITEVCAALL